MSSYIEIRNVLKSFGSNTVLKHINLDVNEGEMVTLLGPSGCGKSTLLRAIAGLNDVDEGSVFIDGRDVTHVDVRQRQVGMVFPFLCLPLAMWAFYPASHSRGSFRPRSGRSWRPASSRRNNCISEKRVELVRHAEPGASHEAPDPDCQKSHFSR